MLLQAVCFQERPQVRAEHLLPPVVNPQDKDHKMPVTTLQLGTDEAYTDAGNVGFNDPFPLIALTHQQYRNLVETRMAAMANVPNIQAIGVPTWNDVVFQFRSVYAKAQSLGAAPPNLLAAYSPMAAFGYAQGNSTGVAGATTATDVTGKTVTLSNAAINTPAGLLGSTTAATTLSIDLGAGNSNGICVGMLVGAGDPTIGNSPTLMARRTDANNWLRVWRQSATNVRFDKDVASATTTEADMTVPSTEPVTGSAIFLRLNADNTYGVWYNGVRIGSGTVSAGGIALTGTLLAYDATGPQFHVNAEIEAWRVAAPYQTK